MQGLIVQRFAAARYASGFVPGLLWRCGTVRCGPSTEQVAQTKEGAHPHGASLESDQRACPFVVPGACIPVAAWTV